MSVVALPSPLPPPRPRAAAIAALALAACVPDVTGVGSGSAGSGSAGSGDPSSTSDTSAADGSSESTGVEPVSGPRKRRLDLDPSLIAGVGSTTLLVVLDGTRIEYDDAQPDGADLRFFSPDETIAFPIQIERWDPAGTSFVWVRVTLPTLPSHLWMYYGEDQPFAAIDPAQVWDDAFAAVWHMGLGEGAVVPDASGHGHHLAPIGFTGDFDVGGYIGPATLLVPPAMPVEAGPLELLDPEALALTDGFTFEAWVWSAVATTDITSHVVRKPGAYELQALAPMLTRPRAVLRTADGSGPHTVEAGGSLTMHQWTYLAVTYRASDGTLALYRNGAVEDTQAVGGDEAGRAVATTTMAVQVGRGHNGMLDEVRVSTLARSPAWIRLQHAAMTDALFDFGAPVPQD
jgi:biopolymer transport protein ExbB